MMDMKMTTCPVQMIAQLLKVKKKLQMTLGNTNPWVNQLQNLELTQVSKAMDADSNAVN